MNIAAAVALLTEIVAAAPTIVRTGQEVIDLVNTGWGNLKEAIGDREVSPDEIEQLVAKIVANSLRIQEIG